jgi:hypothetical protein
MRSIRRALKQTYFKLWMPETRAQHARRTRAMRNRTQALNTKSLACVAKA